MKRIVSLLIFALTVNSMWAYKIQMKDGHEITIPDSFVDVGNTFGKDMVFCGIDSLNNDLLMVKTIDISDFDKDKTMDRADEIVFNLRNHVMTDSESDGLFDIGRDYKIKTYRNIDNGKTLHTYTAYAYNYPYTMLYQPASDTDGLAAIKEIASTIDDSGDTWWHRMYMLFSRSLGIIVLAYMISAVLVAATKNYLILVLSILVGAWLFSPAWGDWSVYLPSLGVYALFLIISLNAGIDSVLSGIADGI